MLRYGSHCREMCGAEIATTNNRMELRAAIEGLRALKEPCAVTLFTDSEYLRKGITLWIHGWRRNGWRTQERKPVKNADLWKDLDAAASQHRVKWEWLKGHAGHADNERCDVLANQQIKALKKTHSEAELRAAAGLLQNA